MLPSCQCFFLLPVVQETPLLSSFGIVSPVPKHLKVLVVPNPPVQMLSSPHHHLNFELTFFKLLFQPHSYVSFSLRPTPNFTIAAKLISFRVCITVMFDHLENLLHLDQWLSSYHLIIYFCMSFCLV